ncbi:MAG: hypothetical protein HYU29_05055 [Chloroflexi bacterium]|nr:hypothetical protein [Chloroflexota bacterium]
MSKPVGGKMSLRDAVFQLFWDMPTEVWSVEGICEGVQELYKFSPFQKSKDLKYPQPRSRHEVRSHLARLKNDGKIERLARNQCRLASTWVDEATGK